MIGQQENRKARDEDDREIRQIFRNQKQTL